LSQFQKGAKNAIRAAEKEKSSNKMEEFGLSSSTSEVELESGAESDCQPDIAKSYNDYIRLK